MRKWRKVILVLILLPAVLYGAVKAFTWYSIRSEMQKLQQTLAPVARIGYREITTPMLGPIGVKGVYVQPLMIKDQIEIGSVLIHAENPIQRFHLLRDYIRDRVPSAMKVSANRVNISLSGEIAQWLDLMQQAGLFGTPLDTLGCGNRTFFSINDLRAMGYQNLTNDLIFDYEVDQIKGIIDLFLQVRTHNAVDLTFDIAIPNNEFSMSTKTFNIKQPKVESVSISYEDEGFNKRKNQFCAKLNGTSEEQFIESHIKQVEAKAADIGFTPSPELINAYREYLTKPSRLTISAAPAEATLPTSFRIPETDDAMRALGVQVMLNREPVKNIGNFKSYKEKLAEMQAQAQPQVMPDTYKLTPVNELGNYLNRLAVVYMNDGVRHHAYITAVNSDEMVLTRQMVYGSATFKVNIKDIREVRVLR